MCSKLCRTCKIDKTLSEFHYHTTNRIYVNDCKTCAAEKRRIKNKERIIKEGRVFNEKPLGKRSKNCNICEVKMLINIDNFSKIGKCFSNICRSCSGVKQEEERFIKIEDKGNSKVCVACKIEKELTENFYYSKKNEIYHTFCITCHKEYTKNNSIRNPSRVISACKTYDNAKGLTFHLSEKFVSLSLLKPCTYCGFLSTGLDRIDNKLGHTEENCVPCCRECNLVRNNIFSMEEMNVMGSAIKEVKENRISNTLLLTIKELVKF